MLGHGVQRREEEGKSPEPPAEEARPPYIREGTTLKQLNGQPHLTTPGFSLGCDVRGRRMGDDTLFARKGTHCEPLDGEA